MRLSMLLWLYLIAFSAMTMQAPLRKILRKDLGMTLTAQIVLLMVTMPATVFAFTLSVFFDDKSSCFLNVTIADSPEEHQKGLMGQSPEQIGDGMLFVFSSNAPRRIWMKNTPTPLDVYFFDQGQRMVGFYPNAEPFNETSFGPDKPVRYILETVANRLEKPVVMISAMGQKNELPCR